MQLSGVTFGTGTSALVCAMNYDHKGPRPQVRFSTDIAGIRRPSDEPEEYDEFLLLGRKAKEEKRHRFEVLLQIHTDQVAPLTEKTNNTAIELLPFNLLPWNGESDFAAYIEPRSNPMAE